MSTISYIPGRVRMESRELVNQPHRCAECARRINAVPGVTGTDVNWRTGRVLVRFEEGKLDGETLVANIREIIRNAGNAEKREPVDLTSRGAAGKKNNQLVPHLLMDVAAHALLPGPLGILLPFAMGALRRAPA